MSAAEIISGPGRLSEYLAPKTNATAEAAFIALRQPSWPKSGFIVWPIEPALRGQDRELTGNISHIRAGVKLILRSSGILGKFDIRGI